MKKHPDPLSFSTDHNKTYGKRTSPQLYTGHKSTHSKVHKQTTQVRISVVIRDRHGSNVPLMDTRKDTTNLPTLIKYYRSFSIGSTRTVHLPIS